MTQIRKHSWWIFLLIFFISQMISGCLAFVLPRLMPKEALSQPVIMGLVLFIANALALLLWFCFRSPSITWRSTLAGLQGRSALRSLLVFLLAVPVMVLLNLGQEVFFPDIPDLVGESAMRGIMNHPLGLLTVAFLGPLSEELLFRGGVQHDLTLHHSDQGWFVPIATAAVFFAVIHLNPAQMPAAFILGCVLGYAYWWTGSLVAPVCIHVFNNSMACLLAHLSPNDDSLVNLLGGPTNAGITALISIALLYLVVQMIKGEGATQPAAKEEVTYY